MSFIFENGHRNISPPCSSSQSEFKKNVNTFSYPTAKRKKVPKEIEPFTFSLLSEPEAQLKICHALLKQD